MNRSLSPLRPDYSTPFADFLDPGEHLLWLGQPRQGIYLRKSDAMAIPFSIMWGGFAIFWESMALFGLQKGGKGPPIIFPLWGIPFVLVGLQLMVGRFFTDAWSRRRIWYAVTNRRALIVSGTAAHQLKSYVLSGLPEIELVQFSDGTGSITFGPAPISTGRRGSLNMFFGSAGTSFERVPNGAEVYRLIRQVQNAPAAGD